MIVSGVARTCQRRSLGKPLGLHSPRPHGKLTLAFIFKLANEVNRVKGQ